MLDFVNFLYLVSLVFILFYMYKIPLKYFGYILFHYILVFLLNDVLFPIYYMPDQFRYFTNSMLIREELAFLDYRSFDITGNFTVSNASLIYSLFPILFIDSVYSVSLINTSLYTIIFIFLYRKKYLRGNGLLFYLFFPSLALYSGVALRDTLVLFFMMLSTYYFFNKKYFLTIFWSLFLGLVKMQNLAIFVLAMIVYRLLVGKFSLFTVIIKVSLIIFLLQILLNIIGVETVDFFRLAFYIEDGGDIEEYVPLTSAFDIFYKSTIGAVLFLFMPFPWDASSSFQFVQSIENIFIAFIIFMLIKKQLMARDKRALFLLIYLFIGLSLLSLVVFNYGTAVRYRYTFVVVFVVYSYYVLYISSKDKRVD